MLDNTTMAATLPIEILADAKVLKTKQKQTSEDKLPQITATNQIKTNKTKTILNWLKNTTTTTKNNYNNTVYATNDNIEINESHHHKQFDKVTPLLDKEKLATLPLTVNDCTCLTVNTQNSTRSHKTLSYFTRDDDSLREFRGVQTLKHFWNKRITANKETTAKTKGCNYTNKQFTKSVSCLVNIINNTGEPPPLSEEERLKVRKLRALSLHDCSQITREDSGEFEELSLTDLEIQKHLEKDNFYKYKTAEQALKLRELSEHSTERKLSNGIIVPKTERLHWLKRHDIFSKRKPIEDSLSNNHTNDIMKRDTNNSKFIDTEFNNSLAKISHDVNVVHDDDIIINENFNMFNKKDCLTLPTAAISQTIVNEVGNTTPGSDCSTPTVTACNSPQHLISRKQLSTRKDSTKTLTSASSISRDSSTTSLTTSTGQRSHVRRNSSTRKYSFKTHSRSYHAPRKMHSNKDHVVATTGQGANPSNSLVAKLTQQFNEIIQKDKTLLEEIKRKNGVLMTHKGHVYKVVDTSSLNRSQSPSISRSSSKAQDRNVFDSTTLERTRSSGSTVQKNIKKFESESRGLKPKVPLKSIQVLKKSNEITINKLGAGNRVNANRSLHKKDGDAKTEMKPQSLTISPALEMVREEAKTPVENKEVFRSQKETLKASNENKMDANNIKFKSSNDKLIEDQNRKEASNRTQDNSNKRIVTDTNIAEDSREKPKDPFKDSKKNEKEYIKQDVASNRIKENANNRLDSDANKAKENGIDTVDIKFKESKENGMEYNKQDFTSNIAEDNPYNRIVSETKMTKENGNDSSNIEFKKSKENAMEYTNQKVSSNIKFIESERNGMNVTNEILNHRIDPATKDLVDYKEYRIDPKTVMSMPSKLESVVYKSILKGKENTDLNGNSSETRIETIERDYHQNGLINQERETLKNLENCKDTQQNNIEIRHLSHSTISSVERKEHSKEGQEGNILPENQQIINLDNEDKENKITTAKNNETTQLNDKEYKNKSEEGKFSRNEDQIKTTQTLSAKELKNSHEELNSEGCSSIAKDLKNSLEKTNSEVLSLNFSSPKSSESPETPDHDEEKKRKSKHKYSKIYEKLRIVNPFAHSNKKQKLVSASSSDLNKIADTSPPKTPPNKLENSNSTLPSTAYTPMSSPTLKTKANSMDDYSLMSNPEAKLLDALEEVDKKLQNLSPLNIKEIESSTVVLESDEYGQPIKPNTSFLHQIYAKEVIPKPVDLIQAVNVTLVNAIEGEQLILEQKELKQEKQNGGYENDSNIPQRVDKEKEQEEEEPLYEPICTIKLENVKTAYSSYSSSEIYKIKTDSINLAKEIYKIKENSENSQNSQNPPSEIFQISEDTLSIDLSNQDIDIIEDDIYQTVEEVKRDYSQLNLQSPEIVINSLPELDGYEPIENPNDSSVSLKCNVTFPQKIIHFDGYEECTPPVDIPSMTPFTPITPTTLGVRKVTDELPDLPQPKRILPKSPLPIRSAPKPPLPLKHPELIEPDAESLISPSQESHYDFGGDENIYDTIKGPHCYESLHSMHNKLQNSALSSANNKNSDSVSLSSNCYESISHYKRTTIISHHSGSSTGSTLTISSENRTNSLYDGSLPSSLHYSSKRIYRSNTAALIDGHNKSLENGGGVNGYGTGSIGRTSDTSDEWTDVTDNENGDDEECKPQFIIVRERSKAHKSPDWSRRVRERQRKSKSCIEEDDPDHYYEQLSPQALSKRHSLLEQSRANSLQRNQDSIRVSKRGKQMSYSAHALGQHISDDSFDSDTDDNYEKGHFKNSHNDSGVDIPTKLPEPPTSTNQMYSIVKKFKNFIVNKKSPNSSKHGGSQQKIYDNTSQFYVNGQFEGKSSSLQVPETKELSTSEKNLIMAQSTVSKPEALNTSTTPRKPKSGKSLKSRLRKSLVGFDNKQLSTLTPTRSTFYIEDPVQDDNNGQLDSGFSEKALSGDLPTTAASTESHKFATLARKAKKEAKLANSQRRRTTIGIRPHEPPPPPPPADSSSKTRRQSNTSWYAECGVFKNGTTNLVHDDSQILNSQTGGSGSSFAAGSTWYEEAGLYQTSGISVASSSGSSGVSTSNEAGPADEMSHSMFSNEPLYQIYSAAKLEAISRDMQDESSTDGYEEIGDRLKNGSAPEGNRKSSRPSALQLIEPKSGPERTLWSQIPEVINSFIIPTMTQRERSLMEAKFEVITSEASYLKSLNLLRTHYMNHPIFRDQNIVSSRDRKFLFAHIVPVHECSEKLLTELESCWQDNIMLVGLSKRIYAIAEKHFHVYIGFCEHQGRMDRTLKRLREGKGLFAQNLELLESSPACCGLNLHSFLMLPMQRITRLPLLIDAVFSKCHPNDDEYENWKMCLAIMNKIVTQCNEAANKSEQCFEIERISRQLEFNPSAIRPLAIAPAGVMAPGTKPRYLVKKGELTHLIWRGDDAKLTFGKKFSKTTIFAFLFSDLLVLTKRKAEEHFSVFDYCPRNMLTITSGDTLPQLPTKDLNSQTSKNLILMTLLENHERKTVELLLSCPSVSEQERWLQAMRPPESETPGEKLYEQWDCPQVIAKHLYENNEPDVLNLEVGDVVNVTRKLPDGWYKGERIRDGAVGWFPGSYTEEVNSVHVRARNLKQRHRLLTFTATYLESQKRNK